MSSMKDTIVRREREILSTEASLGKQAVKGRCISELEYWTRPTYYTPPEEIKARLPVNFFGLTPTADIMERLLKASFSSSLAYN